MQAVAAVLLLSLQAVPAGDTLPTSLELAADSVFQLQELSPTAQVVSPHTLSATTQTLEFEELAEKLDVGLRALKMLHDHPEAPDRVEEVTLSPFMRDRLSRLYRKSQTEGREQALCLGGQVRGNTVHVTSARAPTIRTSDIMSVEYDGLSCLEPGFPFIGILHTHPTLVGISMCGFSRSDQLNFVHMQRAIIDIVLCGPNRMVFMAHRQAPRRILKLDEQIWTPRPLVADEELTGHPLEARQLLLPVQQ